MLEKNVVRTQSDKKSSAEHSWLDSYLSLGARDHQRLEWFATKLAGSLQQFALGIEGADLLQEAIVATLNGQRHCPEDVSVFVYLLNTMRSIASNWSMRRKPFPIGVHEWNEKGEYVSIVPPYWSPSYEPNQESIVCADQLLGALQDTFVHDPIATQVLDTMLDGCMEEEAQRLLGLTSKEYEAAKKRVKRRYMKIIDATQKTPASEVP
jgi:DNA-directed RNA polymerase specialized sigma24 family protein